MKRRQRSRPLRRSPKARTVDVPSHAKVDGPRLTPTLRCAVLTCHLLWCGVAWRWAAQDLLFGGTKKHDKLLDRLGITEQEMRLFGANSKAFQRLGIDYNATGPNSAAPGSGGGAAGAGAGDGLVMVPAPAAAASQSHAQGREGKRV